MSSCVGRTVVVTEGMDPQPDCSRLWHCFDDGLANLQPLLKFAVFDARAHMSILLDWQ